MGTLTDDDGHTASQVISLTITAVDDAATIAGDTTGAGAEDTSLSGTLTASDSADGLSNGSYFTLSTNPGHGSASIDEASGVWSYTPTANYNGSDTFIVTITDDDGHPVSQVISLVITAIDDAATMAGDT